MSVRHGEVVTRPSEVSRPMPGCASLHRCSSALRWHRHVGGRGRSACGRSRIRCRSRGRFAALTITLLAFATGGIFTGRLADRYGIVLPVAGGAVLLSIGYILTSQAGSLWQFAIIHGLLIGIGSSASFGPLLADISHWFTRRRGIAVAICASGNYLAGTIWPPLIQHFVATYGWRGTYFGIGVLCLVICCRSLSRCAVHHRISRYRRRSWRPQALKPDLGSRPTCSSACSS